MAKKSIEALTKHFPEMLFTDSEAHCLYYVTAHDDKRLGILVKHRGAPDQFILLNQEQAYAMSRELKDLLFMIGRGRVEENKPKRGRPRKYERRILQNVCEG